jgi:integrase/recombinase XerD
MDDEDLIRRALEVLQRRAAGTSGTSITVKQLYEKYEAAHLATHSWSTVEIRLRSVVAALAERDVMSLRVFDWTDYRAEREKQEIPIGKPGRFRSAATINCELTFLKALLNWAVAQGRIPHNPLSAAKRVKAKSHRETAPREHDISALLDETGARQRVIVLCATDAGMRRGEIRFLSWDWIDRDAGVITLPGWACKGGRGGPVPATKRLIEAIDAIPRHLRSPYVLTNPTTGEPYSLRVISRWFRDIADRAGIQAAPADGRVHLHDCRHAFASNATRRGVRIEIVSQVLRHASLDQTRDYVQTASDDLTAALERFEAGIVHDRERRGPKRIENQLVAGNEKAKGKSE